MRKLMMAGAIACFGVLSTAPVMAQESSVDASTVLAVVNGTEITLGHVILLRTQLPEQYLQAPDDVLFEGILNQLIDQTLLGDTVATDSLEMRLALENEARAIRAASAIDGVIGTEPTEEELQAAYQETVAAIPEEEEFNASHILVETEDEAKAIISELEGGADFAELAKEKSTGPSGPNGGELGWFGRGSMVPDFENAAIALDVGAISAPVQTQFGWHVIKLNDKRIKPAPTLAEIRDQLVQQIQSQKLEARITELRDGASVETMTEGFDPANIRNLDLLTE